MKFELPEIRTCDALDHKNPESDQTSPVLEAYLRNIREISKKIDDLSAKENENILAGTEISATLDDIFDMDMDASYEKTSLLSTLDNQTQDTIDLLKREAADNIALHIALEDHLMEQMENTQNKLRQNINVYLGVLRQLNELQDDEQLEKGLVQ